MLGSVADSHTALPKVLVAVALGGCIFGGVIATLIVRSDFGGAAAVSPTRVSLSSSRSATADVSMTDMMGSGMMSQTASSMMSTTGFMRTACASMMGRSYDSMMTGSMRSSCSDMMTRGMASMMGKMGTAMMGRSYDSMMTGSMNSGIH
jgi:hypothetical protein